MMIRALALAAIAASIISPALAGNAIENKAIPSSELEYFVASDPIEFAVVAGDLQNGPQGTFGRFPANFETPLHTHAHAYQAVVISGQITNPFANEDNAPVLGPGSFWSVQAMSPHTTACVSDTPCEFFMFASQGFDFQLAE